MKEIPQRNLRVKHIIVDPNIQEHNTLPKGRVNVQLTDIVLETNEGNHTLTHFYMIIR